MIQIINNKGYYKTYVLIINSCCKINIERFDKYKKIYFMFQYLINLPFCKRKKSNQILDQLGKNNCTHKVTRQYIPTKYWTLVFLQFPFLYPL